MKDKNGENIFINMPIIPCLVSFKVACIICFIGVEQVMFIFIEYIYYNDLPQN